MTGSLRYWLAAAFVAVFFVMPSEPDHSQVAYLKTRTWLLDGDGPFAKGLKGGKLPPLEVIYRSTFEDEAIEAERVDSFTRTPREWCRSNGYEFDESLTPLYLEVRVGDNGFQAQISRVVNGMGEPFDKLTLLQESVEGETSDGFYPSRLSLLPAFLAIILAVLTGRVIPALFLGCLAGAILFVWQPLGEVASVSERVFGEPDGTHTRSVIGWIFEGFVAAGTGLAHLLVETIWKGVLGLDAIWNELRHSRGSADYFNVEILGFVVFLFMAVGVMTRSGGIQGMVNWVRRFAKGPISTQICSWIIGVLIFFDDYSNCIITGTAMRPLTDKAKVAREKLAYIVDSTAAPIAGISIFSTWVAYEISMFAPQLPEVTKADGTAYAQADGFSVFIQTIPFRFYCIFTIVTVLLTILMRREFGPMLTAARRAAHEGKPTADDASPMVKEGLAKTEPPEGTPIRGYNALVPLLFLIGSTVGLIFMFGMSELSDADKQLPLWQRIPRILDNGESQRALCFAAAGAFLLATILAVASRALGIWTAIVAAIRSAHSLIFAIIILVLAWSIGQVCKDLGTAQYLTAAFHGSFDPWLLPVVMFLISSVVAFSTGTSYGTMAILLPNIVVLSHTMGATDPELGGTALMLLTIGAVLEGSIFGDHCSPISDTTVLSSVATGSDHLHHVRTQAPYAIVVMIVSMVCGYIPIALTSPEYWPYAWGAGIVFMVLFLLIVGRNPAKGAALPAQDEPAAA